jgi:hypothetical protein
MAAYFEREVEQIEKLEEIKNTTTIHSSIVREQRQGN